MSHVAFLSKFKVSNHSNMNKRLLILLIFITSISRATVCDYALNFTGNTCFVDCGGSAVLGPATQVTVEAWIYSIDSLSNQKIAGTIDPFSNSGYELGIDSGQLYAELKDVNGTLFSFKAGTIPANKWTHIAFIYSKGDAMRGYINGQEIFYQPAGTNDIGNTGANDFIIGAAPWDQTYFNFLGKIDEVRVYDVARSISQIREDMRIDVSGLSQTSLVGYWRFTEGAGTTTNDRSGNNNTATLLGNVLPSWVDSDGPYGEGTAEGKIILCCMPSIYLAENFTITPSILSTPEIFVVSHINCDPGGIQPNAAASYNYGYWIIDRYVQATSYQANLTFALNPSLIDPNDLAGDFVHFLRL